MTFESGIERNDGSVTDILASSKQNTTVIFVSLYEATSTEIRLHNSCPNFFTNSSKDVQTIVVNSGSNYAIWGPRVLNI